MTEDESGRELPGRRGAWIAAALLLALGVWVYSAGVPERPPGYFVDESSISYNAHLISTTGHDEHGVRFPLFFRAFGEYKNPAHVYLLAIVFLFTGPSVVAARMLSAMIGVAAGFVLGLLGWRLSGRREVGLLTALAALLTPWLFELSRPVFEVTLYPLALALYLLAVHRASRRARWSWADAALVAAGLALLTYTYSIGRLLAPLLALGLVLFARQAGLASILRAWLLYGLALVPLLVFHLRHPGALSARFKFLTYYTPQSTPLELAGEFARHYAANFDLWQLLVAGGAEPSIVSVRGTGQVLAVTFLLALAGAWLVLRGPRREPFWLYVLYGLAAAPVPASLTTSDFHLLRLAAVPVFLVVLAVPALAWLAGVEAGRRRRAALVAAAVLTLAQGTFFLRLYHAQAGSDDNRRRYDADYVSRVLEPALARPERPIYVADAPGIPGYVQALWHATLRGVPRGNFVKLGPATAVPDGALYVTTEDGLRRCRKLATSEPYTICLAEGEPSRPAPLPAGAFRAEVVPVDVPGALAAGARAMITVRVRNAGDAWWRARERVGEPYQIAAGNRWLDARDGSVVVGNNGRGVIPRDLAPGEETEITFLVNAPRQPGDYLLELDVLQEGVSWFGPRGSPTVRLPVRVE
ncbi:MAG TPA: glycosyltransferase family 39 protein [Pyrinomonadaceae bacterium]|nr:glycosyltransferase family 39 protein [Pyrinomonadaceae bacterium]